MLRVLVVEDNQDKLRRVLVCLQGVPQCPAEGIDNARDVTEAKRLLRNNYYDLLILDIALPERSDVLPSPEGGIRLLEEVLDRDIYKKPRDIVGLTAFPEVREAAGPRFAEDLWLVIQYDASSDSWVEQLQRKVRHIVLAKQSGDAIVPHGAFLCVITAVQDPELAAVLRLPWNWTYRDLPADGTVYHHGHFLRAGERKELIAAAAPRMGMTAAAVLSMKMIHAFRPRYLAMCGMTAGFRDKCEPGDIIAADPGWDWGSGKWRTDVFCPAPHQIGLNSFLRGKLSHMARDERALDEIRHGWMGHKARTTLRMHLGPVASGAAVIAQAGIPELIKQQNRNVLGIEMETYGVFAACDECSLPQPKAFSLKSVCDFGDADKNDEYQDYAAYTSAAALQIFVERFL